MSDSFFPIFWPDQIQQRNTLFLHSASCIEQLNLSTAGQPPPHQARLSAIYVLSLHDKSGRPNSEANPYTTRNSEDIFQKIILLLLQHVTKKKKDSISKYIPKLRIVLPRSLARLSTRHFRPLLQTYPDLTPLSFILVRDDNKLT